MFKMLYSNGGLMDFLERHLDVPRLASWLCERQHAPEGGLAGRTNKVVDGCYSHWIGGCWSLVEAAIAETKDSSDGTYSGGPSLFNRDGLMRYILCCCQGEKGGLRDKPSK